MYAGFFIDGTIACHSLMAYTLTLNRTNDNLAIFRGVDANASAKKIVLENSVGLFRTSN